MDLDIGFIVLNPDRDFDGLRITTNTLCCANYDTICIVAKDTSPKETKPMKEICPVYKGQDTITSLINAGMKKLKHKWGFIVFAGSRVKTNIHRKLPSFINSEKDIAFPIVNGKTTFDEGSSDGILLNKEFFDSVGEFPCIKRSEYNEFEVSKFLWSCKALEQGAVFKAIAGMRIC